MRYLVTGATGLVGSHVLDQLLARGDTVRALVLEHPEAEKLRQRGVEVWLGDLTEAVDLSAAVDGMDVVLHCAGMVQLAAPRHHLWAVNVEGTERLLTSSAHVGVSRFVYVSSVAVYGPMPQPITEDTPKQPIGAYGESKWAAEQALWRYHADHGLPAVVLRPCPIYGPRDQRITRGLVRHGQKWVVPLPRAGRCLLDLVYVSDVAEAVLAAATRPAAIGQAYNITDGERHTYRDILCTYEQITGRRPAILPVPRRVAVLAIQMRMWWRQARRVPGDWRGQVARVRGLDFDAHYSIDAACRDLEYRPQVGLLEGLRRTLPGISERRKTSEIQ